MSDPRPRGWLLLAIAIVAKMIMGTSANTTALWLMSAVGGFLAALPGRIRRRKQPRQHSTWQGCAACFAAGLVMVLAAGLGHVEQDLAAGVMQGVVSAWAFGACAWAAAWATARFGKGRQHI